MFSIVLNNSHCRVYQNGIFQCTERNRFTLIVSLQDNVLFHHSSGKKYTQSDFYVIRRYYFTNIHRLLSF